MLQIKQVSFEIMSRVQSKNNSYLHHFLRNIPQYVSDYRTMSSVRSSSDLWRCLRYLETIMIKREAEKLKLTKSLFHSMGILYSIILFDFITSSNLIGYSYDFGWKIHNQFRYISTNRSCVT